jgi:hypothetical protein
VTEIDPARPTVACPEVTYIQPEFPVEANPVLIVIKPLIPAAPALAVWIVTDPLEDAALTPEAI